jgi:uncharacterized repeat protein (TIGR02543 family)
MLEFMDNQGHNDFFTFAVPPESEEFEFGQRVTETKTLGGSVFDDYGNDTIPIQIRGTTVNQEEKLVFRKKWGIPVPHFMSGEKEIFELQKLISEWGEGEKTQGKKIYLYDLSKMSALQYFGLTAPSRNYWRVVIKKLKISRSKDKPNTYNYSLDMVGIEDKDRSLFKLFNISMPDLLNKCMEVMDVLADLCNVGAGIFIIGMAAAEDAAKTYNKIKNITSSLDGIARIRPGGFVASMNNTIKTLISTGRRLDILVRGKNSGKESESTGIISRDDRFIVTFNTMGGSYIRAETVIYKYTATRPVNNPVREFYAFDDWYTDPEYTEVFDFEAEITKHVILYAKWTQVTGIVSFNSRLGSPVDPQFVAIGGTAIPPDQPPIRTGYAFECWCSDSAVENEFDFNSSITENITLYARWKIIYTILFNSNDGSAVESQTIDVGGKVIYPVTPERENYLFGIWCADKELTAEYDFNTVVTSNLTLYAKWTRTSNNVTFDTAGGSPVPLQAVPIGGYAVKPGNPVKEGYAFSKWCGDPALTQEFIFVSTPVNYPITLYAAWNIISNTVSFDTNGGSGIEDQPVEYGKLAVYPLTPVKEGCLFARWLVTKTVVIEAEDDDKEDDEDGGEKEVRTEERLEEYDFSTPVVDNVTLYAEWHEGAVE